MFTKNLRLFFFLFIFFMGCVCGQLTSICISFSANSESFPFFLFHFSVYSGGPSRFHLRREGWGSRGGENDVERKHSSTNNICGYIMNLGRLCVRTAPPPFFFWSAVVQVLQPQVRSRCVKLPLVSLVFRELVSYSALGLLEKNAFELGFL